MWRILTSILGFLVHRASAHGGALNYTVGDASCPPGPAMGESPDGCATWYPGYSPFDDQTFQDEAPWMVQRKWITNNPIVETNNISLSCNDPGNPARTYIPIRAGQNITAVYMAWVHTVGPMIAWMAHCTNDDCGAFDSSTASWFKIGQRGLQSGTIETGDWFQKTFSNWDGNPSLWSETVPRNLKPGKYLVRHEIISLHSANKPQFYPECAHVEVSGEGVGEPGQEYLVRIPGVWNMDMPEINIDVYAPGISNSTVYNIPGPPVWTG
ncbi:lytic polysaccharide monooxygenase [Trematosphaeria pertusa]|uniref:AA9 family lytic polysaccharide monooxygenase n=1 Tax=Trematosphaeria pertusa TaxID=390896 RepID=A0A6A6I808_9PLEO|nr:lytic polysaccharide monooxygenase [Trematosphaeria pertusa]KAF2246496.1 lytic polysaccharide monooxygenase [Trematosphaeria pertusa]